MNNRGTRLSASDIGLPENFQHVLQIAWNDDGELEVQSTVDPELEGLFQMGGITDDEVNRERVSKFLKHLLGKQDRMAEFKKRIEQSRTDPPPSPSASSSKQEGETTASSGTASVASETVDDPEKESSSSGKQSEIIPKVRRPAPPPPPTQRNKEAAPPKIPVPAPRSILTKPSPTVGSSDDLITFKQEEEETVYDVPRKLIPRAAKSIEPQAQKEEKMTEEEILNVLCDYISKKGGIGTLKREVRKNETDTDERPLQPNPAPRPSSLDSHLPIGQNKKSTKVSHDMDGTSSSPSTLSLDSVLK